MFAAPLESVLITPLADNSYELLDSIPSEAESGWDTLTQTYLLRNSTAGLDPVAAIASIFTRGSQVAGLNMWIVARAPRVRARGLFEVEVTSKGLLSTRGYKVNYDSASSSQSGQNITLPYGTVAKASVQEAAPTAELEYILIGTAPSSTSFPTYKTGRSHTPPAPWEPAVPPTVWAAIAGPTYHWPDGWVFDGARCENLPGVSTVHLVRERYRYQYRMTL